MTTLAQLAKGHLIPYGWLKEQVMEKDLTVAEAVNKFENPTIDEIRCELVHEIPYSRSELDAHVEEEYGIPVSELVQIWADHGYRRHRIAWFLNTTASRLANAITDAKVRIRWKHAPEIDSRGATKKFSLYGKPITMTEFATRYGMQVGSLSDKWHGLTAGQVSQEMLKIANKTSPIRAFLTQRR